MDHVARPPARWWPRVWLTEPRPDAIARICDDQRSAALTYASVGASGGSLPDGWFHTDRRCVLGSGEALFERAVDAVQQWKMFDIGWLRLAADGPPHLGQTLAFASRQYGLWGVHAVRVVAVVHRSDEQGRAFEVAYGTLPHHAVCGEERFIVRWDVGTDEVSFRIRQFSLPNVALTASWPSLGRRIQLRFVDGALSALAKAVAP